MKFILLLALVGCAVNVQVTAAAAISPFYGTYDADERYAAANAAPLSIKAAAAENLAAAAAPYPAAASLNAADAVAKISLSDYADSPYRSKRRKGQSKSRKGKNKGNRRSKINTRIVRTSVVQSIGRA